MKSMWESPESFEAHAAIGYCYWRLGEINKEVSRPRTPIVRMVDSACGYDPDAEHYKEIISLLEAIIEQKKIIKADTTKDEEILTKTKGLAGGGNQ